MNVKIGDHIIRKAYGNFPEAVYTVLGIEPAEYAFLGSLYTLRADDGTALKLCTSELENNLELWARRGGYEIR